MPGDGAARNSSRLDSVPSQATIQQGFERQGPGPCVSARFCSGRMHSIVAKEQLRVSSGRSGLPWNYLRYCKHCRVRRLAGGIHAWLACA